MNHTDSLRFSDEKKKQAFEVLNKIENYPDFAIGVLNDLSCDEDIDELLEFIDEFNESKYPYPLPTCIIHYANIIREEREAQGFNYDKTYW